MGLEIEPEIAPRAASADEQYMDLLISDLWHTLGSRPLDRRSREQLRRPIAAGWRSTEEDLVAACSAFDSFAGRAARLVRHDDSGSTCPAEAAALREVRGELTIELLLNRVSRALHRAAELTEPGDLPESAFDVARRHLETASISARRAMGSLLGRHDRASKEATVA